MVDANLKATSQGKMMRFKHVLTQIIHHSKTNKSKLVRTKYLFLPKEHKTLRNGHIMPFVDQLMIRLSAQYHPNLSNLQLRVAQVNMNKTVFDVEKHYEFSSMKALRTFVKRMKKNIQRYKRLPTLSIWAKYDLFRAARKASVVKTKKRR